MLNVPPVPACRIGEFATKGLVKREQRNLTTLKLLPSAIDASPGSENMSQSY